MDKEMGTSSRAGTWSTITRPTGKNIVGAKLEWVFRIKYKSDGTVDKYKARLVAPAWLHSSLWSRLLRHILARRKKWRAFARSWRATTGTSSFFDFGGAYLNGTLNDDEEIYCTCKSPPGTRLTGSTQSSSFTSRYHDMD
jgi:hypothetical protein